MNTAIATADAGARPPAAVVSSAPAPAPEGDARRGWLKTVAIAWLMIWAGFVAMNFATVGSVEFHDPDDELRLVQVRDLIAGQSWFDLHQYRVDAAGGGVAMHWSRLVDAPIAALIVVLRPFVGQPMAEFVTLLAVPGLTLFAMLALVGWMASRTLDRAARLLAILCVAFAAPAMVQALPLRIDHHGWQIVMALASVAAFLDDDHRRGGWLAGAALATWMAISFEGLPFSAWYIAVLAVWTLVDPAMRTRLTATIQSLTLVSVALFLATRGVVDLAEHCDAIAPVHLTMFGWGALAALPLGWRLSEWIAGLKRPANPVLRMGELAGVAALVFCAVFPVVPVLAVESLFSNTVAEGVDKDVSIACSVKHAAATLDALPAGDILAPLDFGPNVLLYSNKGVLATGHHRGAVAMRAVIDAFSGAPDQAREVMREHRLRYVMICPKVQEMDLYRERAPKGFAAQMLAGKTPPWLLPVPLAADSGLRMWALTD